MNLWEGKHVWIWVLDQCGAPEEVVARAVSLGLTGLLVKGWDGSRYWPQIEQIVGAAHTAGIILGAWGYSRGTNPAGEAAAARLCLDAGADWLLIDAEAEYETYPGRAQAVCDAFKALGVPLGYTSFGLPRYHAGFPWQTFSEACDVALPQVYWGEFGMSVDDALARSLADMQRYGLPVAPAGQSYGNVTPDDIVRFGDLVEAAGLPGISYYDWQHASAAQLAAVGAAPYERKVDTVEAIKIKIGDKVFDGQAEGGHSMGPVRDIAEALGAAVSWDEETKTVTIGPADDQYKLYAENQRLRQIIKQAYGVLSPAAI